MRAARSVDPDPVNPARAGMIPMAEAIGLGVTRKPRASGDDPGRVVIVEEAGA